MKKLSFFIIFLIFFLTGCSEKNNGNINNISKKHTVQIVTSIPPVASIAQFIGGETIQVNSIVQPGFSPETFDLKPSNFIQINNADLIISTGLSIDSFLNKSIQNKDILVLKNNVNILESQEYNHVGNNQNENHPESEEIFYDPHIWLSLENGNKIAESIKNKLIEMQPKHQNIYNNNYDDFLKKSQNIKNNFTKNILNKTQQNFIIEHTAYNYLFEEMNIDTNQIIALSETVGENPSVSQMKDIINTIEKNNIKVIFKEPQINSKIINTLSKKYSLKVFELDPLGKSIQSNGYFKNIQTNLNNLLEIYE